MKALQVNYQIYKKIMEADNEAISRQTLMFSIERERCGASALQTHMSEMIAFWISLSTKTPQFKINMNAKQNKQF